MADKKSVCIIGGGIAGLSAAVFLAEKGFDVTLLEASPKFGGRAYSFFDKTVNDFIDNGQHIFASWYYNTFEFLKITGSFDKLTFHKQLKVRFADSNGSQYLLKCPNLPPPFHLIAGIMSYNAMGFKDKNGIVRLIRNFKKIPEQNLKCINTDELFNLTRQSEKLVDYFWKPFIIAVFNAEPKDTSAWLFIELIKVGFLQKGGSNLVLPNDFLGNIFVQPAVSYLETKGAKIFKSAGVSKINFKDDRIESLITNDGKEIKSDYFISAVSFYDFKSLIGDEVFSKEFSAVSNLQYSPIVNIHLKFESEINDILKESFIGILNSPIQWVFKVKDNQICIVISSANEVVEMDKEDIIELSKKELYKCLPAFKNVKILRSRVIKEKRATFVPDTESLSARPKNKTKYKNFFIAGDWTDTGLPATIEGAVKSSKNCVSEILIQV